MHQILWDAGEKDKHDLFHVFPGPLTIDDIDIIGNTTNSEAPTRIPAKREQAWEP